MPPLFGLAPGGVCRAAAVTGSRGALLPHPFDLAAPEAGRYCFLWHFPWGRPRRALPGTVVPWSPDFPRLRLRKPRPPGPLAACHMGYCGRGSNRREQFRAAFAVDRCRRSVRAGSGAGRRSPPSAASRDVIAEALEREQEAGVGPVRVDQVARRPRQRQAAPAPARPRGTARPDPPCAPARRPNGRRHCRGRYRGAP